MRKRGQITIFIVVVLVVLIAFSLLAYVNQDITEEIAQSGVKTSSEFFTKVSPIQQYVELCLNRVAKKGVFELGLGGGYIQIPDMVRVYNTSYWYLGNTNIQPTREEIKGRLSEHIENNLLSCTDFEEYTELGFIIETEKPVVVIELGPGEISINADYRIKVISGEFEKRFDKFSTTVGSELSGMYNLATTIITFVELGVFESENPLKGINTEHAINIIREEDTLLISLIDQFGMKLDFGIDTKDENLSLNLEDYLRLCGDSVCSENEDYVSCSADCSSGSLDGICDLLEDGICDPDCDEEDDIDCKTTEDIKEIEKEVEEKKVVKTASDNLLPCIEKDEIFGEIVISESGQKYEDKLPSGYTAIGNAFNVDCQGEDIEITLNAPDNFIDVKVMKCDSKGCINEDIKKSYSLTCSEADETKLRKSLIYTPKLSTISALDVTKEITKLDNQINSGKYYLRLEETGENKVSLSNIEEGLPEPKNRKMKITSPPLVITAKDEEGEERKLYGKTFIRIPYEKDPNIDEKSLAIYGFYNGEWEFISGEKDENEKVVIANVLDIEKYVKEGKAIFAIIGMICDDCIKTELKRVYSPKEYSRDAILFVHGLASGSETFSEIIGDIKLTGQPWQVYVFDYPLSLSTDEAATELANLIEINSNKFEKLDIVAHSLGGIVAQKAIYQAYSANKGGSGDYDFLSKVDKLILVAVPNKGSFAADAFIEMFSYLINLDAPFNIFNNLGKGAKEASKGASIPKVSGIDYYVIAGTLPYDFSTKLFSESLYDKSGYIENDGFITVDSAKTIGGKKVEDMCKDYYEINTTHTSLVDDNISRKVILRLISEEKYEEIKESQTVIGHNQYYKLNLESCEEGYTYVLIGKQINEKEVFDETGCACGNKYCGLGETPSNCPKDCAEGISPEGIKLSRQLLKLLIYVLIAVLVFIVTVSFITRKK